MPYPDRRGTEQEPAPVTLPGQIEPVSPVTTPYDPNVFQPLGDLAPVTDTNSNLPFHPWIRGYDLNGNPVEWSPGVYSTVQRGHIRSDPDFYRGESDPTEVRKLYFLYNPSTFTTSFGAEFDNEVAIATYYTRRDGGEASPPTGPLQQSLSFQLLFDRTYEVSYALAGQWMHEDLAMEGAWRDVRAMLALVDALDDTVADPYQMTASQFWTKAFVPPPCFIQFGTTDRALTVFGIITGVGISWTHFSREMIPIRVGMQVDVQIMPRNLEGGTPPPIDADSGSSSSSSGSSGSSGSGGAGLRLSGTAAQARSKQMEEWLRQNAAIRSATRTQNSSMSLFQRQNYNLYAQVVGAPQLPLVGPINPNAR